MDSINGLLGNCLQRINKMLWPKDLNRTECRNFPRSALPALMRAIDEKKVLWSDVALIETHYQADFEWLGSKFRMLESSNFVYRITLIRGGLTEEDLVIAILSDEL